MGLKSAAMYPLSKDRMGAPWRWIEMLRIYAMTGDTDGALAQIDKLLSVECWVNATWMRENAELKTIREDPRFLALMRKYDPNA